MSLASGLPRWVNDRWISWETALVKQTDLPLHCLISKGSSCQKPGFFNWHPCATASTVGFLGLLVQWAKKGSPLHGRSLWLGTCRP